MLQAFCRRCLPARFPQKLPAWHWLLPMAWAILRSLPRVAALARAWRRAAGTGSRRPARRHDRRRCPAQSPGMARFSMRRHKARTMLKLPPELLLRHRPVRSHPSVRSRRISQCAGRHARWRIVRAGSISASGCRATAAGPTADNYRPFSLELDTRRAAAGCVHARPARERRIAGLREDARGCQRSGRRVPRSRRDGSWRRQPRTSHARSTPSSAFPTCCCMRCSAPLRTRARRNMSA